MSSRAHPAGERRPWRVDRRGGPAGHLHDLDPAEDDEPTLRTLEVDGPALVLGSSQPATDVDADAARALGVAVVRRRSGGGAVLLDPGAVAWLDIVLTRSDARWDDDVVRSMVTVGEWVAGALDALGLDDLAVHHGPLDRSSRARVLCFGGLGPGEVTQAGRKLVGLSQRRTRDRARIQCAVLRAWDGPRTARLLAPALGAAGVPAADLDDLVAVAPEVTGEALLDRLRISPL